MPAALRRDIDQEIFQRPQQKRAETAAVRIGELDKISLHDHEEKILGKVLGIRLGITFAINEREDWSPIDVANLSEAGIDLAPGAGRAALADQAPARSNEMRECSRTLLIGRRSHASSVNGSPRRLKNKLGN